MNALKSFAFAVAFLAAFPAHAVAHAYAFATTTMGTVFDFMDTDTIQTTPDGNIKAWTLFVETNPSERIAGELVRYHRFQMEYDCAHQLERGVYGASYDYTGKPLLTSSDPDTFHQVISGTENEILFKAACNRGEGLSTTHVFGDIQTAISFADSAVKHPPVKWTP